MKLYFQVTFSLSSPLSLLKFRILLWLGRKQIASFCFFRHPEKSFAGTDSSRFPRYENDSVCPRCKWDIFVGEMGKAMIKLCFSQQTKVKENF